jgi:adenosylhomocysteine nucleosidase
MKLLLIASAPMEFQGILARCERAQPVRMPVDWARSARLGSHEVMLAANGAGPRRAAAALDAATAIMRPDLVVSTGFCGALDPRLEVADVVAATGVASGDIVYRAVPVAGGAACRAGLVCSIDRVAQTAGEKLRLSSGGAIAVEMEAAGVAARAGLQELPFSCIRAVTDLAGESMANDFNAALREDGHFDTIKVLAGSLRHPFARLPELRRLRQRSIRAARALGDFLADCRF